MARRNRHLRRGRRRPGHHPGPGHPARRRAADGQQDKLAILYQELTGPQFRQRVEAIKDAFTTMQEDLDAERRVITKQWQKRAKQIERVMASTVGMEDDLHAIAGTSLLQIDGLELKALNSADAPAVR